MAAPLTMAMLIERFTAWAQEHDDIRVLAILGSQARTDRPADQWSDLDLVMVVVDPTPYLADGKWLHAIAPPILTFLEGTAVAGQVERRVMFEGALDVDVSLLPATMIEQLANTQLPDEIALVLGRGNRTLFDRDGIWTRIAAALPEEKTVHSAPPSAREFDQAVNDFLYHAVWATKKLLRGEVWMAKQNCDGYLKRLLCQMIGWHAGATSDWQVDTWHNGRFLDQWAAPEVLAGLPAIFASYDPGDIQRALLATVDLYGSLATPVAVALQTSYPHEAQRYVRDWIASHASTNAS